MKQISPSMQKFFGSVLLGLCIGFSAYAKVTISGVSSGGFMATQMGTIYSSQIDGVGSLAGGFFYCAQNHLQEKTEEGLKNPLVGRENLFFFERNPEIFTNVITGHFFSLFEKNQKWLVPSERNPLYQAMTICVGRPADATLPDLTPFEKSGLIDSAENIKNQKIYIYHGELDRALNPKMLNRTEEFYLAQQIEKSQIKIKTLPAGHNFPTDKPGLIDCKDQVPPYIASCEFNLAKDMLEHLLGRKLASAPIDLNNFYRVDQNLTPVNEKLDPKNWQRPSPSIAPYGYLYASKKCLKNPTSCETHVALHGCEISDSFDRELNEKYTKQLSTTHILTLTNTRKEAVGLRKLLPTNEDRKLSYATLEFASLAGYIELAEKNDLMILFPQTWITAESYPYNPKGCWDWYGATGSDYATNKGAEPSWMMSYIKNITKEPKKFIMSMKPNFEALPK